MSIAELQDLELFLEFYCVRCDSNKTELRKEEDSYRWCWVCNDWQQSLPETIKDLCRRK